MLSVAAIVVSTGLLLGPCGPTTEPGSTVPGTSEPTTTTTTTSPATTTTTTVSPAAGAPVVTLAPLTPEEAEVVEALYEARTLAIESLMDPDAPDLEERLDARYARGGQQREAVEANLAYVRENGFRVRTNAEMPWVLTVESVSFIQDPYPRADVQVCYLDTSVLYEPGGAPDGSDAVVNEDFGAIRIRYSLVTEDGSWQLYHGQNISEMSLGATTCESEL
jgi:hypothetical protein